MKLTIPLKKPAPAPVAEPPPPPPPPVNNVKGKLVLAKPKPKPAASLPVIAPLELKDLKEWAPRECTFCGHTYGYPCDGKAGCANHDFIVAQSKKD